MLQHDEEIDYRFDKTTDKKSFIIGAFNHLSWRKESLAQGSRESYIFTLLPKFRNYFPKRKNSPEIQTGDYSYMSLDRQKSIKLYQFAFIIIKTIK